MFIAIEKNVLFVVHKPEYCLRLYYAPLPLLQLLMCLSCSVIDTYTRYIKVSLNHLPYSEKKWHS